MEFLDEGVFRIRDSEGQIIELDRTKSRIYISNNDLKSTQAEGGLGVIGNQFATNSTDAEYILLDKEKQLVLINARQIAQIYSFDRRKDVTEGNHRHKVGGNSEWLIGGDESNTIAGAQSNTIGGDQKDLVEGDKESVVVGDYLMQSTANAEMRTTAGGFVKIDGAQVSIGGPAAELLDLLDQQLDALIQNAPTFVSTAVGPGVLNPAIVALLTQIKTLLATIKGGI